MLSLLRLGSQGSLPHTCSAVFLPRTRGVPALGALAHAPFLEVPTGPAPCPPPWGCPLPHTPFPSGHTRPEAALTPEAPRPLQAGPTGGAVLLWSARARRGPCGWHGWCLRLAAAQGWPLLTGRPRPDAWVPHAEAPLSPAAALAARMSPRGLT